MLTPMIHSNPDTTASSQPSPPLHYMLPLFPAFQLLDVAGPLDILNLLSINQPACRDITLTFIASTLDPVPTKPVAPRDPATGQPKWTFHDDFPTNAGKTNVDFTQSLVPHVTFTSYLSALSTGDIRPDATHKPIDVLLIPGGLGTRITRTSTSTGQPSSNVADLLAFIPQVVPHIRHSIVTVCTGSDILGQTGLLDTRRATTNMTRFDDVVARSPHVKWQRARRWVRSMPAEAEAEAKAIGQAQAQDDTHVFRREIWTSAGISAGIDVTLAFVAEYYGGLDVARKAARSLEYEWREIPEGAVDPMYGLTLAEVDGLPVVDQS